MKKIIKDNKKYIVLLLIAFSIFFVLKKINNFRIFMDLDIYVKNIFDAMYNVKFEKFLSIMSDSLVIYIPLLIIVCMFFKFKKKIYFKIQLLCYLSTFIVAFIIKNIIQRQRPLINMIATIDIYSFPSSHTICSFVFYFLLAYLMSFKTDKKIKFTFNLIATIIVLTVAVSRLYLGVHYMSDIIGSIIFGIIILKMIKNIIKGKYERKLI